MLNQPHKSELLEQVEKAVSARVKQNAPNQVSPDREGRRVLAPAWGAVVCLAGRASSGVSPEKTCE